MIQDLSNSGSLPVLEKVLQEAQGVLIEAAEADAELPDPQAALARWLRRLADHSRSFRGLAEALMDTLQDPSSPLYGSCEALHKSGAALIARAQAAGTVRGDVSADDALGLVCATAWVAEHTPATDKEAATLLLARAAATAGTGSPGCQSMSFFGSTPAWLSGSPKIKRQAGGAATFFPRRSARLR